MAKGISLEQFKNQLDTDAQQRCLAQEKTIKELEAKIKTRENHIRILQNRCRVLSSGVFCDKCGMKDICKSKEGINTGRDVDIFLRST